MATTYLICLDAKLGNPASPRGQAGHYVGSTTREVAVRLAEHRAGVGARMLAAAVAKGISFDVVRTWDGGRETERRIKRLRNAPRLCPTCTGSGR